MKRMTLAVISLAVGAVGCTGGPGPAPEPTAPPSPSDEASVATSAATDNAADPFAIQRNAKDLFAPLPLDAYRLTTAERYQLDSAIKVLVDRCMADFGFPPGEELRPLEELVIDEREARNRLYGLTDVEQAKVTGLLPASVLASNSRPKEKEDPTKIFVLLGSKDGESVEDQTESPGEIDGKAIPPNGCLGDARKKIYGTNSTMINFVVAGDLTFAVSEKAGADPKVVAAEKNWVSCMAGRGYSVQGMKDDTERDKATAGLKEEERPTKEEIQLAVAEAECNNEVGYHTVANQVNVELQNKAIEEHQLALTEERQRIDDVLAKANEVLKEN